MKRRQLIKRSISMFVLCAALAAATVSVSAAPDYTTSISPFKRLNGIWYYYMPGKYWNHAPGAANDRYSVRTQKCTHHGSVCGTYTALTTGSCGCNSYMNATQCHGFAKHIAALIFGTAPDVDTSTKYKHVTRIGDWLIYSELDGMELWVGDVIRSGDHTAVVYQVKNGYVTVVEALGGLNCEIRWGGFNGTSQSTHSSVISQLKYVCRYAGDYIYLGDLNSDRYFDAVDMFLMNRYLSSGSRDGITARGMAAADVDHNGFIQQTDADLMRSALSGSTSLTSFGGAKGESMALSNVPTEENPISEEDITRAVFEAMQMYQGA